MEVIGQPQTPGALPFYTALIGLQSRSGCFGEELTSLPPVGFGTPNLPVLSLVPIQTTIPRLHMKEAVGFPEFGGVLISSAFCNICLCSLTAIDWKISKTQLTSAELIHADMTDGRADRHAAANRRFSRLCERAQKSSSYFRKKAMHIHYKDWLILVGEIFAVQF